MTTLRPAAPDLVIAHRIDKLEQLIARAGPKATFVAAAPFAPPDNPHVNWTSSRDYVASAAMTAVEWDAVRWLKELAHQPIAGHDTLVRALEMHGTSLWWFGEMVFYRFGLRPIVTSLTWLQAAFADLNPARVVFVNDGSVLAATIRAVSQKNETECIGISLRPWRARLAYERVGPRFGERALRPVRDRVRGLLSRAQHRASDPTAGTERRVLMASMAREEVLVSPVNGDRYHGDLMLGPCSLGSTIIPTSGRCSSTDSRTGGA